MNIFYNITSLFSVKKTGKLFNYFSLIIIFKILIISTGCGGGGSSSDKPASPEGLSYKSTSAVYTKNLKIADNVPNYTGTVMEWSVDPVLPEGLVLDQSTGIISGTPVSYQGAAEYTVTASNEYGSATAVISITVKDIPPSALDYLATSAVYTKDLAIADNIPTVYGSVTSWSVTPDLPEGLSFDSSTGIISGTPTVEQSVVYYTVTASNPEGSATAEISITVDIAPPTALEYQTLSAVYIKNTAITANGPSYYGTVTSWSVTPDLPEGLSIDPETGIISGTPLSEESAADYTITAANKNGSTTAVISIKVNDVPPSDLSYSNPEAVYTQEAVIAANNPSVTGTVTTWSVTPDLPQGLTLNTATGIITGIPENVQPKTEYVITASNTYGSASAGISITVNEKPPSGLSYTIKSAVYTQGKAITKNIPILAEGSAASWSVTPALPKGLILNTTTGVISGIPSVVQAAKSYTVTATNSQGSTSAVISIKIHYAAPTGLKYTPSTVTLGIRLNVTIFFTTFLYLPTEIKLIPSCTGTVTSWSVDKTLPAGVTINSATGIISGKGIAVKGSTTIYTVTARNSGGSVTAKITIKGPPI